ncbi:MAG: hypothetical protein V3U34_00405 [candidate division NC10 bacterium]
MTDNIQKYGFRWAVAHNGGKSCPAPVWRPVASAYQASLDSNEVNINMGDMMKIVAGGTFEIADGDESTSEAVWGVCVAVGKSFDGNFMESKTFIPGGTTWGTNRERQTLIGVVPVDAGVWSIEVTGNAAAFDTETEYLAAVGKNANFTNTIDTTLVRAQPRVDISTAATTNTLILRLYGVDNSEENQDFSGNFVKMLVVGNIVQNAPHAPLGV